MAVKPVKNVPKNPYGSLGPTKATVNKVTPNAWNPPTSGWGNATQANNLNTVPGNTLKYDVPGTAANPSAPAVTAPAKAASTPGYWNIPDYASMLAGDWEPGEAAIQGQKQRADAEASFQENLRRAFIDYGGNADKLDDKFRKYIDDPTIEAAKTNKFSTMAQNLAAQTKSLRQQRAALAGRGMSFSGANTEVTRKALEARELADYGAGRDFLSGAETGLGGLSTVDHQIAQMITDAKSRAAARIAQENPQTWVPGTGPDYAGEAAYGGTPAAAAPKPFAGVQWGGHTVFTKADLQKALGYNQNINDWAKQHQSAWNQLT